MTGWNFFAILLIVLAILLANRSKAKDPAQAVWYMSGWFVTFVLGLAFFMVILPLFITYAPQPTQMAWSPVISRTGQDVSAVGQTVGSAVASIINVGGNAAPEFAAAPTPSAEPVAAAAIVESADVAIVGGYAEHVVQAGESLAKIAEQYGVSLADLVRENALTDPNRLEIGQVLRIPVEVQVTATPAPIMGTAMPAPTDLPLPTATATPLPDFAGQYNQLENYKATGNRTGAREVIAYILGIDPSNAQAHATQIEIDMADALFLEWQTLSDRNANGTFVLGEGAPLSALVGFRFETVMAEKIAFANKWKESVTVKCQTAGWLFGETITMARGHAAALGADDVGDFFTVNGGD